MVDGSVVKAKGWGGILIALGSRNYLLSPVFHCPQNPKNTFTPTTVLSFSNFSRALVDTHQKVVLIDNDNHRHDVITIQDNNLDFAELHIVMMNSEATLDTSTPTSINVHPCTIQPLINALAMSDKTTDEYRPSLHPRTIEFYVMLHKCHSPREKAVHNMNKILNSRYQPFIPGAARKATMIQKSLAKEGSTTLASLELPLHNEHNEHTSSYSSQEIIQPIMNKLSRSVKTYYSPLQQYQ